MITLRRSEARGHADHGWLDSRHTFSFAGYHDPDHMGFRDLRVINDDIVQAGQGFGTHGHRDMEIVSYVVDGALEHRDSMGTGSVLRPGDVQRMTAGRGVTHSEFNHSPTDPLRFLQIWILPQAQGLEPSYEEKHFAPAEREGGLCPIVAPDGADGALRIHQDVRIFASLLAAEDRVSHEPALGRHAWLQVVNGRVDLNGHTLDAGDGAAISDEARLRIGGVAPQSEFLLFDLA
jgi:redox-sensitive bicupin YhaK (pirin superfamily)